MKMFIAAAVLGLLFSIAAPAPTFAQSVGPVICPNSSRCYQAIRPSSGVSFDTAISQAQNYTYRGKRGVLSNWQSLAEAVEVAAAFNNRGISLERLRVAGYKRGVYWFWSTGSQLIYSRWAPGEPNNSGYNETSLILWTRDGRFADVSPNGTQHNNAAFGFLIEYAMQ